MIDYDHITETADRRWTARLLDRVAEPVLPEDELGQLAAALQAVSDPRSVGPLLAVLTDEGKAAAVRTAASQVLRGMDHLVPSVAEHTLRQWWTEGDPLLRREALLWMDDLDCPDIVLQVAADATHELQAEAIGEMVFFFDRPEHEAIKIAGLTHPDARVRAAAAEVLYFDEPVQAEESLIEATRDPVPEVAAEACRTLEYYPSLRNARWLYALFDHPCGTVREAAEASFEAVRDAFLFPLRLPDQRVARHVRKWLDPLWDMLEFTHDELLPYSFEERPSPAKRP